MKNKLGQVTLGAEGYQVRFERIFPHSIQTVWDAITNPEKLKYWFTDMEFELREGAKLTIFFRDEAKSVTYGRIIEVKPPHRFVFSWETEMAVWELSEASEKECKLVLTYSKVEASFALNVPAGMHVLLDRLDGMLAGERKIHGFGTEENDPQVMQIESMYAESILKDFPDLEKYRPLVVEKTYNAPVERVWKAITDAGQMKKWYFDLPDFKAEAGFEFSFMGKGHKGENYKHLCKVLEVVPERRLIYTWTYEGYPGYSTVLFELTPEGDKTRVRLMHRGLQSFPEGNPDFAKSSFTGGWNQLIGTSLKNFVEQS